MRIFLRGSTRSKEQVYRAMASWRLGSAAAWQGVHHVNGDRRDHHPDNLAVVSSQRGHMLLYPYLWRQEAGVQHLFDLEETLEVLGEYVGVLLKRALEATHSQRMQSIKDIVHETALDERALARLGHLSDRFFTSDAVETEMIHFAR